MDTPFYHDDSGSGYVPDYDRYPGNKMLMTKKTAGGHHFPGGGGAGGGASGGGRNPGGSLMAAPAASSSDVNLLKLTTPDLEHLIIHSNQGPAPGSAPTFIYRGQATNEQEGFADGFVKALADLHKQNQLVGGSHVSPQPPSSYQRGLMGGDMPVYTNLSSYSPAQMGYAGGQLGYGTGGAGGGGGAPRLDAPQTVPEVPHPPGDPASPPSLSPIDLETQERIKAERKKLRNRIAASKCRKRKLERISRLEEKVKVLKSQNCELSSTASVLREQVASLKQKVMSHVTNGCQIAVGSKAGGGGARGGEGGDSSC
ncbi:transcription factor jun-D-like isoform X2 [Sphaeramia orbicularis]|uniref:Transcription factor jun-D-like n=2 Tax=Sphaeramia orbicularis TaxID=375764 RepID=A0A673BD10_9TELE|nr:transcription factor jun-D-like isoform X2 [Sphaeramia orbicularis]XP_029985322.1 transcription factor jun-D-like isoform X2 [Sphaeramia orbicularis]XP_029985324.1 transcription factor jun-D-like isoform X2 [Sphaeramia orbicularis]XP_029985325.1 transcription factor jun-D-like isoform X2 [Sphaeramia orbicularis]